MCKCSYFRMHRLYAVRDVVRLNNAAHKTIGNHRDCDSKNIYRVTGNLVLIIYKYIATAKVDRPSKSRRRTPTGLCPKSPGPPSPRCPCSFYDETVSQRRGGFFHALSWFVFFILFLSPSSAPFAFDRTRPAVPLRRLQFFSYKNRILAMCPVSGAFWRTDGRTDNKHDVCDTHRRRIPSTVNC